MSPDFNYSEVPATFLHCLNKQCKHSAKCMRYLVTAYVPDNYPVISTVNPNYFSSHKESCPYFMADKRNVSHSASPTCWIMYRTKKPSASNENLWQSLTEPPITAVTARNDFLNPKNRNTSVNCFSKEE